ncbi:hypothetical protein ITJ88_00795 [Exiguobacterium sp. TBG-PICH-001]|uniref:hypothetical protein n=1 Tax=Exiguobacterium abrahamii TaxID=2785532 RepID=UPI0018A7AC6F|nr:hypothetical protein [Exiguobacterium sp. TBG-PICH-001]MBF8151803.1 hypothetical protein [Exiguobacterium sp. TBG-PICH-001]
MHRSLQALQFYTSHSKEDIARLHERVRSSLASTESLTDTMIRITGQPPLIPYDEDTVTVDEWNAFLAGKHHETLADFYGTLVARPILDEDGPLPDKEKEPLPTLSRSHREPEPKRRKKVKEFKHAGAKRPLPWGWIALLILCFLLGASGTYVYSTYFAGSADTTPKATVEKPVTVEKTKEKKPKAAEETAAVDDVLYVKTRSSNIYREEAMTTLLYEADFGDGYRIVKKTDGVTEIELSDDLTGFIKTSDTTKRLEGEALADETLLTWANDNLDTSFVTGTLIDLIGKSSEELNSLYGPADRTFNDELHDYLFYGNHFFVLKDNKVIAIDWTETTITNEQLASLSPLQLETESTGLVTSNSYRLQRFAKDGTISRIRLAEQSF